MMNKEMAIINGMNVDVTTVMDTTVTYEPSYEEAMEVKDKIRTLLDEYFPDYIHEGDGLDKMFSVDGDFWDAKGWLIKAFQKHPAYNGNYQIVLRDQDMCRYINKEQIDLFFTYVYDWFSNNKCYKEDAKGKRYTIDEATAKRRELRDKIRNIETLLSEAERNFYSHKFSLSGEIGKSFCAMKQVYSKIEDLLYNQRYALESIHYENQYELDMFRKVDEYIHDVGSDCQFCDDTLATKLNKRYNAAQTIKKAYRNGMSFAEIANVLPYKYEELLGCKYEPELDKEILDMCATLHTDDDLKKLIKTEKQIAASGQKISKIITTIAKRCGITNHVNIVDASFTRDDGEYVERTKDRGWNGQFADFADSVNPITLKATAVISVNPYDFYTMSFGKNWASCHTIDKENKRRVKDHVYTGCYCGGTESYMRDKYTIIFYYLPENFNGDYPEFEDKIKRCVFFLGEDKLIQSRVYPDGRDGGEKSLAGDIRTLMQKIVSDLFDVPNYWSLSKGTEACVEVIETNGVQYPDYAHYDDCNVSYLKRIDGYKNKKILPIGRLPICPECGEEHDNSEHIFCYEHKHGRRCSECGDPINGEPIYIDGEPYCEDCVSFCDDCGDPCINPTRVHNDLYVCEYCLEEDYIWSEYDDEYINTDNAITTEEGNTYHENSSGYGNCANCGESHDFDNLIYDEETDDYYCEDCYNELMEERSENEEE